MIVLFLFFQQLYATTENSEQFEMSSLTSTLGLLSKSPHLMSKESSRAKFPKAVSRKRCLANFSTEWGASGNNNVNQYNVVWEPVSVEQTFSVLSKFCVHRCFLKSGHGVDFTKQ